MGVKISIDSFNYLLLNVYMPSDDRSLDSLAKYRDVCAQIQDIIENDVNSELINNVILAGDFNADPHKGRFWMELINLLNRCW